MRFTISKSLLTQSQKIALRQHHSKSSLRLMTIINSKKIKSLLNFLNFSLHMFRLELRIAMPKYRKKSVNNSYIVLKAVDLKK